VCKHWARLWEIPKWLAWDARHVRTSKGGARKPTAAPPCCLAQAGSDNLRTDQVLGAVPLLLALLSGSHVKARLDLLSLA
jgi:hypothetical protein